MRIGEQKSASMQKRTRPLKFGHLADKSGFKSVPNLSTKVRVEDDVDDAQHAHPDARPGEAEAAGGLLPGARAAGRGGRGEGLHFWASKNHEMF